MIGKKISQYLVIEKLGEGGMGIVYLAEDSVLGRRVAIKTLKESDSPEFSQYKTRFLREARLASTLNHPNIVSIFDYGEADGQPYLVMEFVKGQNLADVLRTKQLPVEDIVRIVRQIAQALAEAHGNGIVHRDLKPSNIFLNERGEVKVLDFGLAKLLDADIYNSKSYSQATSDLFTQTREGVFMGTPSYSSPEQLLGTDVDGRSDIFSLGAVLYECLAGQPAFKGKNFAEICAQVIKEDPVPPSTLNLASPVGFDSVALKALSKRAEQRYQTIQELIRDLETAPAAGPTGEMNPVAAVDGDLPAEKTASTVAPTGLSRSRIVAIAISSIAAFAAIAIALTGGFQGFFSGGTRTEAPPAYAEGVTALRNGNYYKAAKLLETAVQQNSQFPLAHARLAEALSELGFEDRATGELIKVSELAPTYSSLSTEDQLSLQAIAASVRRNFDGAKENYSKLVESAPDDRKKFALFDLGRALEAADDTAAAIENYNQALSRDPQFAAAAVRLGVLHGVQQKDAEALAFFGRAEEIYNSQSDYDGVAEVSYQTGYALSMQEKLAPAAEQMNRAAELAEMTKNTSLRVKTLLQLSNITYALEDQPRAIKLADEAIELARREGLDSFATIGLIETGNIYFIRGDFKAAEAKFSQALERAKANEWPRIAARSNLALGSLFIQQGKSAEAIGFAKPALEFYQKNNFRKEVQQAQLVLGYANDQTGNYDAAIASFTEQLEDARKRDDKNAIIYADFYLGLVRLHQEKFTEALALFDETLEISRSLALDSKIGYSQLNRAQALIELGRLDEARTALDEAATIASKPSGGDKQLLAWTSVTFANIDLIKKDFAAATAKTRKAVETGGPTGEIAIHAAIIECLVASRSGQKGKGVEICRKAAENSKLTATAYLMLKSNLALAEASLAAADAQGARAAITAIEPLFSGNHSLPSQWRNLLIAAKSHKLLNDDGRAVESANRADQILTEIEKSFGPQNFATWLSRPDIQSYRN